MPLSLQRLSRNQLIFREVNERVREMADGAPNGKAEYLCECGDVTCTERIQMVLSQYEAVRARPNAFLMIPGHERLEVERILDTPDGYMIVEKIVPLDDAATRALTSTDD